MESLSRISSVLESARDLTLEAAQSASAAGRLGRREAKLLSSKETRKFLNSRIDREVLDGLRRVITMMSRGNDCSEFFADVVKNVASPALEIKKLVYIYLLRYAEFEPDLALLSINTIQKALNDQNQVMRAMAIRVMSGIRVPVISQIVALAIKKGVTDLSSYVRKCAALAIPKCYKLDPTTMPQLTDHLGTLLGDRSHYVMSAAVMAFLEIAPSRYDLIHPHFRTLVKLLIDMDEWGQLAMLRLLNGYARKCFPVKRRKKKAVNAEGGFYSDDDTVGQITGTQDMIQDMDPDLELFLSACSPLLQSRNSAVIVAVARVYRHLAPSEYLKQLAGPLASLLRAPINIQHIALISIVSIALKCAQPFSPFVTHFLVQHLDPPHIWRLKLEILTLTFPFVNTCTKNLILSELEYFAQGYDQELIKETVRAIGRCAQSETRNATRCLRVLLRQVESSDGVLLSESLTVIRHIIQQNPTAHSKTVIRLAKALDTATNPTARASIIWLVGEFSGIDDGNNVAADSLRILAKNFLLESDQAKQQIILLAAKVYAHHLNRTQPLWPSSPAIGHDKDPDDEAPKHSLPLLFSYILLLGRYDMSYDIRDRARLYKSLLANPSSTELATLLLLAPKPTPQAPSPSFGRKDLTLGSAAMILGQVSIRGYEPLPDWINISRAPSPSLREHLVTEGTIPQGGLAIIGIAPQNSSRRTNTPEGFTSSQFSNSPKFPECETKSNGKVETSLEDFLASEEESEIEGEGEGIDYEGEGGDDDREEREDEEEEEDDDADEEEEEDDDDDDDDDEDSEGGKENSQLLGGSK
ncbi:adaptin N terminal region-domain-containing protein [Trichophaea hybrida]|nr:adaptin N terminal region-domain-containing protein [Trichophaea hybrida]